MHDHMSRRNLLKGAALGLGGVPLAARLGVAAATKPAVYFTKDLSPAGLRQIYAKVNAGLTGKIGIKLHTGEPNGPNLLPIEFIKSLQPTIPGSTILECNVLYPGPRAAANTHRDTLKTNGFTFCSVDIMDAEGDATIPVPGMKDFLSSSPLKFEKGRHLTEVAVGKTLLNYDSLLVYTHFKGHAMGGFGGSLKNISIGCASGKVGKQQIHDTGWPRGPLFLERMVEGGKAITSHFGAHITYINVLKNLSVDCDCDGHGAKPTAPDIGILGSTDILAIDQASIDMVYALPAAQKKDLVERIESRSGLHQLEYMETLQMGSRQYELVTLGS
jgi:uncharacterized Fe-S center protein